jgi:hypothetical protein
VSDETTALPFEGDGRLIRRQWVHDRWYFSVVDVVAVLTDSVDPGAYWRKLKQRLLENEGASETVTNCHVLKMRALDGKLREKDEANRTHFEVGQKVRKAIADIGGTKPEHLPTPAESIQELQRREQQRLEAERQPSLWLDSDVQSVDTNQEE